MPRTFVGAAAALLVLSVCATAGAAPLSVGDTVTPLQVAKWIRGPASLLPARGRITVVEFWATWCGPCVANIPHLSALERKYAARGVDVVGATSPDEWGNDEAAVRKMAAARRIGYRIAWLPASRVGRTSGIHLNPWYRAADVGWLPCAFVIDREGRIAYIGDPLTIEPVIASLVEGRWDLVSARRRYAASREARVQLDLFKSAVERKDRSAALAAARVALEKGSDDPRVLLMIGDVLTHGLWMRDPEFVRIAVSAGESSVRLTNAQASGSFDVLARARFLAGDRAGAVDAESHAMALSEGGMREAQRKNLESYRRGVLPE